jgi:hypothetical protein
VTQLPVDKERRINVHFRLPFLTKWGQSLIVTGTGVLVCSACTFKHPQGLSLIAQHQLPAYQAGLLLFPGSNAAVTQPAHGSAVGMHAGSSTMTLHCCHAL